MTPQAELAMALDTARPTIWWRDDDAAEDDPRLVRLLTMAARYGVVPALAVIPARVTTHAARLICASNVAVFQHGWDHANHAGPGERKIELGGWLDAAAIDARLLRGHLKLRTTFGERFAPILVPPWNRFAVDLHDRLPRLGYRGISIFGPTTAAAGLAVVNAHVDTMVWRGERRSKSLSEIAIELVQAVRRHSDTPVGLLTHHLVMTDDEFQTLDRLLAIVRDCGCLGTIGPSALFGE